MKRAQIVEPAWLLVARAARPGAGRNLIHKKAPCGRAQPYDAPLQQHQHPWR
ncbi:MAG: hypothetical protein H6645_05425 [Caldilineaceae bacterium]|nr:hypothetical protein [Caldilineaceae bacterium]